MDNAKRRNLNRELLRITQQEKKLHQTAMKGKTTSWKQEIEKKIPDKTYQGLVSAFTQGFSLVFKKGKKLIEITYDKKNLRQQHEQRDSALRQGTGKLELKQMRKSVSRSSSRNLTATTAEGIALGIFGVGLPDIVLFLSTLLKGIYETALHYGFDYESRREQYWILCMMTAAMSRGRDWERENEEVDSLMTEEIVVVTEEVLERQIREAASVFAVDMLLLKFIQGMPVVGLIGGAANPVYYHRVMEYVQLKYRKRYLLKQLQKEENL